MEGERAMLQGSACKMKGINGGVEVGRDDAREWIRAGDQVS